MSEYQATRTIQATPEHVFDFVSDVRNLPQYLPTTHDAKPQGQDRVRVQGQARGHDYNADGWLRRDENGRRLEWGSDGDMNYSGSLEVRPSGGEAASVTVKLHFDPPEQMKRAMGDADAKIQEGLEAALQSIANHCEGHGGKVEPQSAQPTQTRRM